MYLNAKAHIFCGGKQPSALLRIEYACFKEYVAKFGKLLRFYYGQHLFYYKIDILCGPAPVFFGYGMRAQICRHNAYLMAIGKPFYHIKLLKLVGLVKPIAAFYLNGCNALAHKLVKEAHAPFKKLVFARAPCGPYG